MSFKKFSAAQDAAVKDNPGDKPGAAPTADKPVAKSDKAAAEVAPQVKS